MKKTSILIHYTHKQTLGHTTRVLAIANELTKKSNNAVLTILQGGLAQPFIHFPEQTSIINIPAPFDSRASFKGISGQGRASIRARFVLEAASKVNPDVFITEFFPFGRLEYMDELLPVIKLLRKGGTRIYASIGYPHLANIMYKGKEQSLDLIRQLIGFYDRIMIHTPEKLENDFFIKSLSSPEIQKKYKDFMNSISSKTIYTGYILPPSPAPSAKTLSRFNSNSSSVSIIVSRGGGAVYPKIIACAIQAKHILGKSYHFIISSGPATSPAEGALYKSLLKKYGVAGVTLHDYLPDLGYYLHHAHASISMCGYNTSVQLLHGGTPSVIVPYVNDFSQISSNEQLARAYLLQKYLDSTIITYDSLKAEELALAIAQQCQKRAPRSAPRDWFQGNKKTATIILQGH